MSEENPKSDKKGLGFSLKGLKSKLKAGMDTLADPEKVGQWLDKAQGAAEGVKSKAQAGKDRLQEELAKRRGTTEAQEGQEDSDTQDQQDEGPGEQPK